MAKTSKPKNAEKVVLARKHQVGMGDEILLKLENFARLYAVDLRFYQSFEAWVDGEGSDLYWMGRRVEHVYSPSASGKSFWSVPLTSAIRALLKRKCAIKVAHMPEVLGELPT